MKPETLNSVAKLAPIAGDLGLSQAQLAIAWVLQNKNVAAALVGASRPEQLRENVKASGVVIPADAMAEISTVLAEVAITDPGMTAARAPQQRPS